MAKSNRILEMAFAIGGKLNPDFISTMSEAGKKLKDLAKQTEEATKINKLAKEQSAVLNRLGKEAGNVGKAWGNVGGAIMGQIKTIAKIGTMAAGVGVSIYTLAAKTAEFGDKAVKTAKKTGMTTESFSSLSYAAELSGISQESLSGNMIKLNKNIAAAVKGNKEAELAFRRAGVSIYDAGGKLKSTDQIMMEASDMFAKMPEGIYKADLAMALFGKSGADMVPLMEQGSAEINRLRKEAERLGITFDDAAGKRAEAFRDSITAAKASMQGLAIAIGKQLHGPLTEITNSFTEWIVANREWISLRAAEYVELFKQHWPEIRQFLTDARDAVVSFANSINGIVQATGGWGNAIANVTKAFGAFAQLKLALTIGTAAISTIMFAQSLWKALPVIKAMAKAIGIGLSSGIGKLIAGLKMATIFTAGLLKSMALWVVANPIVLAVAAGIAVLVLLYKNWDKMVKFRGELWDRFVAGFKPGIDAMLQSFSNFGEQIGRIWRNVTAWLGERIDDFCVGFKSVWDGIVGFFSEKIDRIIAAFSDGFLYSIVSILSEFHPAVILNDAINKIFGIDLIKIGGDWIKGLIEGILSTISGAASTVKEAIGSLIPAPIKGAVNAVASALPKFAEGGIITKPQLSFVGEAGPEAIIPLTKPSRAMEIMRQAGLSAPSPTETLSSTINNSRTSNSIGGNSFNFSPNVTINGGSDSGGVAAAVQEAFGNLKNDFERWILDREYNLSRVAMG